MPKWRKMAGQWLPEFAVEARRAENPMEFWSDLRDAFRDAYRPPRNESFVERVYGFADWCQNASRNKSAAHDLPTCVAVCFLEHIPEIKEARLDMPRWFTLPEILGTKDIFSYHIGEASFAELVEYVREHRRLYRPWRHGGS
jgi:hypothetical protein